ncbi:hypothetical protein P8A22_35485 [Streptomyces laculatispora]|uniref:Uncharacterized protein n=1 Tax=Streptomyces laculatispora TaxID=887464 RepID=A0ABY9IF83_9ACTN|nr:hypothetical protein [Streptomyces laculatispora]WLQ45588.1 hypothetical protein P8A22_35485 [Streptomyces laculatispora]
MLESDALAVAAELFASVDRRPEAADPDVLHTIAAFYWVRSLAHRRALAADDLAARDLETAIGVLGLLYLVDHRRVPGELWPRLADETAYHPWSDPLEHAADLIIDGEENGDIAALDQAISVIRTVADSGDNAYRDTLRGLAHHQRAAFPRRPAAERSADADAAVELLGRVAALPEPSAARRAGRGRSFAEALVRRFDAAGDNADLTRAERAYRDALADAADDPPTYASAAAGLGSALSRRVEAAEGTVGDGESRIQVLREAVSWLRRAVDLTHGAAATPPATRRSGTGDRSASSATGALRIRTTELPRDPAGTAPDFIRSEPTVVRTGRGSPKCSR